MTKLLIVCVLGLFLGCSNSAATEKSFLFVQSAAQTSFDGATLTLTGVSPVTVFFSDRPNRSAGSIPNLNMVDLWNEPKNKESFAKDPPNAALSYIDTNTDPQIVIVELSNIAVHADTITYTSKVLDGELPETTQEASLVIDDYNSTIIVYASTFIPFDSSF